MNVLKKRFVPLVLACVLVMALAAPAFATSNYSTTLDGQYVEAVIDVTVPTTGQVFINPYALPVKLSVLAEKSDATDGSTNPATEVTGGSIIDQQLVTEPLFITNKSEVNLAVGAKVVVTLHTSPDASSNQVVDTKMKFVTEAISSEDTSKSVYAYLQMKVAEDLTSASDAQDKINAFTGWTDDSYNSKTDLLLTTNAKGVSTENPMAILKAGEDDGTGTLEATAGSIAMFRIAGQVVTQPKDGWDKAVDTFTSTIAFTFTPDPNKASIKANPTSKTIEATNGSIALTVSLKGGNAKITGVTWSADDAQYVDTTTVSGTNNVTCTVKPAATATGAGKATVTITATVTADNGMTYTATCDIVVPT